MTANTQLNTGDSPLPDGFGIVLDRETKRVSSEVLIGGSPARILRLSAAGQSALADLATSPVGSRVTGRLARRLTDSGAAHPVPPRLASAHELTVLIPVCDRVDMLARCLDAVVAAGAAHRVLVVDDGSREPLSIAQACADRGVELIRRESNGGPAAARNTGLAHVTSEFVAFLDSDCVPAAGWIETLTAHLADPLVGAVAPRILALPAASSAGRYARAHGSLDLGERAARVVPRTRVGYVPTAALIVRRAALLDIAADGEAFDPALRYGEDVDLIWRLHSAGWRIRYDPSVQVAHEEPHTWKALLARRLRYGSSAGPLALRHRDALAPLVLYPWPAVAVAGLVWRRPAIAALGLGADLLSRYRTMRRAGMPTRTVVPSTLAAAQQTALGVGRFAVQFGAPVVALSLAAGGRRRWGRRLATAVLALAPPLSTWLRQRPALDPVRFCLGQLADDLAYGTGVWTGSVRARTTRPIRPAVPWRSPRTASSSDKQRTS